MSVDIICTTVEKEIKEILSIMRTENESNHNLLYKHLHHNQDILF